ncbi:hypothetical protein C8F01DRAFT_1229941 [Mycena amicta]|nr:hypothetical protein C8F01DRAFT_1229941 [Mycena amicta]
MKSFHVDAVLFDMDGTLTDSIGAVEAAWEQIALELGRDPAEIIALTHGKRAADNLAMLKPEIESHEMDNEVALFEQSILAYADAYHKYGLQAPTPSSGAMTPALTSNTSSPPSRPCSPTFSGPIRPGFITRLSQRLVATARELEEKGERRRDQEVNALPKAWELEAATVNRSVKILPGVRRMLSSIPKDRYAVATSGARTYADDARLGAGKPAPDPFLLAAKCLGFEAKNCVVFEDSPNGIRAGVASGATVIAVCTSHERSQIENCGAHFIIEDMNHVECQVEQQGGSRSIFMTPTKTALSCSVKFWASVRVCFSKRYADDDTLPSDVQWVVGGGRPYYGCDLGSIERVEGVNMLGWSLTQQGSELDGRWGFWECIGVHWGYQRSRVGYCGLDQVPDLADLRDENEHSVCEPLDEHFGGYALDIPTNLAGHACLPESDYSPSGGGGFAPGGSQGTGSPGQVGQQSRTRSPPDASRRKLPKLFAPLPSSSFGGQPRCIQDADWKLGDRSIGQITLVAEVRDHRVQNTHRSFLLDDGTGTMNAKLWVDTPPEQHSEPFRGINIEQSAHFRITGNLRSHSGKKYIHVSNIRLVKDMNEIYYHILDTIYIHVVLQKGLPSDYSGSAQAAGATSGNSAYTIQSRPAAAQKLFSALADRVANYLQTQPSEPEGASCRRYCQGSQVRSVGAEQHGGTHDRRRAHLHDH